MGDFFPSHCLFQIPILRYKFGPEDVSKVFFKLRLVKNLIFLP